jgi:hypothetical protein
MLSVTVLEMTRIRNVIDRVSLNELLKQTDTLNG